MKIDKLAKFVLLPGLLFPALEKQAQAQNAKAKDQAKAGSTLVLDPISLVYLGLHNKLDGKYHIAKVYTDFSDTESFNDDHRKWFDTIYKIDTKIKAGFYFGRFKEGRTGNIFKALYDEEDKEKGLIFPKPKDELEPVAIIDGKEAGMNNPAASSGVSEQLQLPNSLSSTLILHI